jgi:Lar family restriction alleviation protein
MMCMGDDGLKPCPFCGGTNILMRDVSGLFGKSAYTRTYHYMQCRDCMSQTGYHGTKPKSIGAWNRRVPQTAVNQYGENCTNISNCGTLNLNL